MNERIRGLREQALRWAGENVNRNLYSNYEIEQKEYEKFAELIVRECALVVHKKTGAKSALNVLEHFGVESA